MRIRPSIPRRRAGVVDALGEGGDVVGVGQADRRGVVGGGDELDVDGAAGGARDEVLIGDVAEVLRRADDPGGGVVGAQEVLKSVQWNSPSSPSRPSGSARPLRAAIRPISSGGALPSRWTCSSAWGTIGRTLPLGP
jgi:hypothetical protein